MRKKNIGKVEVSGRRYASGFGYIIIPKTLDRDAYIQDCYRTKSVSIITENGAYEHRVPISDNALDSIIFPTNDSSWGSPILWNKIMPQNKIVITDVFSYKDNWINREENSFILIKDSPTASVSINGNGNKGNLIINVEGNGLLNITVNNKDENAEMNLFVQGNINVIADGSIKIESDNIEHNDGSEQMVKGNVLKDEIIDQLIKILLNVKTSTAIGLQPFDPKSLQDLQTLLNKTKNILSDKSRLE